MPSRLAAYRMLPFVFWMLAIAAVPFWNAIDPGNGWDAKPILNAIHSVQAGHDPYLDGIAARTAYNSQRALHPDASIPYFYIYSPITLPLLRLVAWLPVSIYSGGYWLLYAAGALTQIIVVMKAAENHERVLVGFLAPAAVFFPGLLQHDAIMSGNLACIFYGLVLVTALLGWRRGQWQWFYLAVLAASCFKPPMLTLLAIPLLSARKQKFPAALTACAGLGLFAAQYWIWPSLFQNYLHALDLEFRWVHGFGFGPAGMFGRALLDSGIPYTAASTAFYMLFALALLGILFYLSRQFFDGKFSLQQWIPVLLTGVILLNPRIQEYDVAPLSLCLAMILWRSALLVTTRRRAILACVTGFVLVNATAIFINTIDVECYYWNHMEGFLLIGVFTLGCWSLVRQSSEVGAAQLVLAVELQD